jgi:hypothetical protein
MKPGPMHRECKRMGTQAGFDTKAFGPFGAMIDSYFAAIDSFAHGKFPFMPGMAPALDGQALSQHATAPLKAAARCQLETYGLLNRRMQAYMQVPTRLAQCRTPQDLLNEQMAFWRIATEQYRETAVKIGQAWGQSVPWTGTDGAARSAERDYITFNGAGKDATHTTRPDTPGAQRRVA